MSNHTNKEMKITKDMTIEEIMEKNPNKIETLIEAGMHCIMCPASQMETLEEACAVHGIDPDEMVEKLNERDTKTEQLINDLDEQNKKEEENK